MGIFQPYGKVPLLNDLLNIMDNGIAINSPTDFTIEIGPGYLLLCIFIISSKTISGVKCGYGSGTSRVYCRYLH